MSQIVKRSRADRRNLPIREMSRVAPYLLTVAIICGMALSATIVLGGEDDQQVGTLGSSAQQPDPSTLGAEVWSPPVDGKARVIVDDQPSKQSDQIVPCQNCIPSVFKPTVNPLEDVHNVGPHKEDQASVVAALENYVQHFIGLGSRPIDDATYSRIASKETEKFARSETELLLKDRAVSGFRVHSASVLDSKWDVVRIQDDKAYIEGSIRYEQDADRTIPASELARLRGDGTKDSLSTSSATDVKARTIETSTEDFQASLVFEDGAWKVLSPEAGQPVLVGVKLVE